jgi:serine protease
VAGTIGFGRTNNNVGVAGVNWEVSVQPVRVLGKCGGTTGDIAAAIRWAAGVAVPGVPANARPARASFKEVCRGMAASPGIGSKWRL